MLEWDGRAMLLIIVHPVVIFTMGGSGAVLEESNKKSNRSA
jgi:hypothetical protein